MAQYLIQVPSYYSNSISILITIDYVEYLQSSDDTLSLHLSDCQSQLPSQFTRISG